MDFITDYKVQLLSLNEYKVWFLKLLIINTDNCLACSCTYYFNILCYMGTH